MRIPLLPYAADSILATTQLGKRVFAALVGATSSPPSPTLLFLDFSGVEIATASFLREGVVTFRDHIREHVPHLYPVPANFAAEVKEELAEFLRDRVDAMAICNVTTREQPSAPQIVGQLDGKQLLTMNAALKQPEIDATALMERFPEENVGSTAWNNRLAALSLKGLLIETSLGRAKRYRPVLENITYGR
jgi:hypothetical protein